MKNLQIMEARGVKSDETWAPGITGFYNKDTGITHYLENITFENISLVTKAAKPARSPVQVELGQALTDPVKDAMPVEMPTRYPAPSGSYNVRDLGQRPAYGFYVRHVKNFVLNNCSAAFEDGHDDGRYAVVLDDVVGAAIDRLTVPVVSAKNDYLIKVIKSSEINMVNSRPLQDISGVSVADFQQYPSK